MPRRTILKGGTKELSDFFKVFSFDEMRDKTKRKKGEESNSFINKTAKTITSTGKGLARMTGLTKVAKKTSNVVKGAVRKTSNVVKGVVRKTGKVLIKKRPRRKIKKSKKPKKSKKSKKVKKVKKVKKSKK
tara:strand:- start:531 stop:923 length:393 start_codon:yes stop_codon:yes gene_type:complete